MSTESALRVGTRVLVPWGLGEPREAIVVEVWGDPSAPSHIRVQLLQDDAADGDAALLLLSPGIVALAA